MKRIAGAIIVLLLNGCHINPYTFAPNLTTTDWYDAGMEDAIAGLAVRDEESLADTFSDSENKRREYRLGYLEGQRKTCQHDFIYAKGVSGQSYPGSCESVENAAQLHAAWKKGADEYSRSIRLN